MSYRDHQPLCPFYNGDPCGCGAALKPVIRVAGQVVEPVGAELVVGGARKLHPKERRGGQCPVKTITGLNDEPDTQHTGAYRVAIGSVKTYFTVCDKCKVLFLAESDEPK